MLVYNNLKLLCYAFKNNEKYHLLVPKTEFVSLYNEVKIK